MRRTNKKGFTIVELVIVIAVIAILAAVLIPTFSSLVQKANESTDTQLIKNLNTALTSDTKKHSTMSEALAAAEKFGYDVAKINASATGNEILWDSVNDLFCYLNDGEIEYIPESLKGEKPADYKYWQITDKVIATADQKYSIYWNSDADFTETLKVGFDCGIYATDLTLTYENTDNAQDVVIYTNGGTLTINAPNDNVRHYGNAATVNVTAVADASYHAYGTIGTLNVTKGHVVIEESATVSMVTKSGSETSSVTNNGTVTVSTTNIEGKEPDMKYETAATTLTNAGGYVKLGADQKVEGASLALKNDTVLDLNGYTITFANVTAESDIALDVKGVSLTVMDSSTSGNGTMTFADGLYANLIMVENGSLTINGGNYSNLRSATGGNRAIITAAKGSTVVINGGIFEAKSNENRTKYKSANILYFRENCKCYINGGTFISGNNSVLAGNGTSTYWGTYMEINGGTFESKTDVVLYHPQVGIMNIQGGKFIGDTVLYQKAGTVNITGGVFEAKGNKVDYYYNNSGADSTGDCILVDSCVGYGGESVPVLNITLSSSKITSKNAKAVAGYVYGENKQDAVIIWNGEAVDSIAVD